MIRTHKGAFIVMNRDHPQYHLVIDQFAMENHHAVNR